MIDIELVRKQPGVVAEAARNKNVKIDIEEIQKLDQERRGLQQHLDELQRQRNELARLSGKPTKESIEAGKQLKEKAVAADRELQQATQKLQALLERLPNIPTPDTPIGPDASGNKVLRKVGDLPVFSFQPKPHWELGELLGVIDTESAAEITGSRFTYLKGRLAMLQFALIQHAFSVLTDEVILNQIIKDNNLTVSPKSFTPVITPVFIRPEVMQKMARLEPKDERYYIPSDNLYLIGSAEHTLGPLHMNEVLPESEFPIRYAGYSTAFRREAGSHGQDVRGILRVHQFDKVEMESFATPEQSIAEQDFIVAIQEYLMQSLKLPYQVVITCTGDMGDPDARHIDIETWLPGQGKYRETHSADLMTDYQSRRLRTKVKRASGTSEYVHMNDATVFAIGRTLVAILENYQQEDGSVQVPEVLQKYVPFTVITK